MQLKTESLEEMNPVKWTAFATLVVLTVPNMSQLGFWVGLGISVLSLTIGSVAGTAMMEVLGRAADEKKVLLKVIMLLSIVIPVVLVLGSYLMIFYLSMAETPRSLALFANSMLILITFSIAGGSIVREK